MSNFLRSIYLRILSLALCPLGVYANTFRCDLYFMKDPSKRTSPSLIAPKIKEYPLNLRVRENSKDGPILPAEDLRLKMGLEVHQHLSWVIPSFSQRVFLSLSKENLVHPFGIPRESRSALEELFPDYMGGDSPSAPTMIVNRQLIGMMEIFSYKNKRIKCLLSIFDRPYQLQIQDHIPVEQWIVLDTPSEVAILYISPL